MFERFEKRKKAEAFFAPVDGTFVPLSEVADPVIFTKK